MPQILKYQHVIRCLVVVACLFSAVILCGCNRAYYRKQADHEVGALVECASNRLPRPLEKPFTIQPDHKSRFFDGHSPDCPPMPPDDPISHEYMNCVDGKRGYPYWDCHGRTQVTENPHWRRYLPTNKEGVLVVDRDMAVELALVNSPDYQTALENVYLSALSVTAERFEFDTQFFGGNSTLYTADGRLLGGDTTLETDNDLTLRRRFATGGELVAGIANSFMWQFAGPDTNTANTLLNFNFVQPLLRYGGRDYALEDLTDSERALLANIRLFERFRRGFYTTIMTGGGNVGSPTGGNVSLTSGRSSGNIAASGYLGLLQDQVEIRNQEQNIAGLQDSLSLMIELFQASKLNNSFQVEQTRQSLLNSQSRLLQLENSYASRLDSFKMTLGLPPDLDMEIRDELLKEFELIDPRLTALQDNVNSLLASLRNDKKNDPNDPLPINPLPVDFLDRLEELIEPVRGQAYAVQEDLDALDAAVPDRIRNLEILASQPFVQDENADLSAVGVDAFKERVKIVHAEYPKLVKEKIEIRLAELQRLAGADDEQPLTPEEIEVMRRPIRDEVSDLSSDLMLLALIQARARLDTLSLTPVELSPQRALMIASENRRDWMNARAELVDTWREIQVRANELESDLDIKFSGQIDTVGDNPVKFRSSAGRLSAGIEFDAPLTRLLERNNYRRALISYQRAKRDYYTYRDSINESLRNTLRIIQFSQLNFELQRAAVLVAVIKVDLARENLMAPMQPGGGSSSTLARDLNDSLQELLSRQNSLLGTWVDYQAQRMTLDLDMGTMQLDPYGMWVDPGAVVEEEMIPEPEGDIGIDELPADLRNLEPILPPGIPNDPMRDGAAPPNAPAAPNGGATDQQEPAVPPLPLELNVDTQPGGEWQAPEPSAAPASQPVPSEPVVQNVSFEKRSARTENADRAAPIAPLPPPVVSPTVAAATPKTVLPSLPVQQERQAALWAPSERKARAPIAPIPPTARP